MTQPTPDIAFVRRGITATESLAVSDQTLLDLSARAQLIEFLSQGDCHIVVISDPVDEEEFEEEAQTIEPDSSIPIPTFRPGAAVAIDLIDNNGNYWNIAPGNVFYDEGSEAEGRVYSIGGDDGENIEVSQADIGSLVSAEEFAHIQAIAQAE